MLAAADRVTQRSKNPEHSADDQQDHPDGPQNRDFEHESENEKNDSESDHERGISFSVNIFGGFWLASSMLALRSSTMWQATPGRMPHYYAHSPT